MTTTSVAMALLVLRNAVRAVEEAGAPAVAERLSAGLRAALTDGERVALADLLAALTERLR